MHARYVDLWLVDNIPFGLGRLSHSKSAICWPRPVANCGGFIQAFVIRSSVMYSPQKEMLARARAAEIARASTPRSRRRSSLRIMLDARLTRRQGPAE